MLSINCKGRLITFEKPLVMGIINTTPDSFYSASRKNNPDALVDTIGKMLEDGAAILDIGGQSTRPGSERISANEEMDRVIPAIEAINKVYPDALISIDTFYGSVAKEAIKAGAALINDVSAGSIDDGLLEIVRELQVPYVLMHMQGNPQTMQKNPVYENIVLDVFDELIKKIELLKNSGIKDIIIDPGFGFGKTINHNFQLLSGLHFFQSLQRPIMVGLSRKGTIYKTLNVTPEEALNGSTVLHTVSLLKGAHILRVHDVKEASQAVKLISLYQKEQIHI